MRTKGFVFCFLLAIIYMACDDTISRVGLGIQPDEDKVTIFDTMVYIEARTVKIDSLYAKTVNGFLGELYDPSYGVIKSSYICQYYPAVGFPYLDSIVDNKIDSVILNIGYYSFFGDSIAPMEVTVYPVVKALDHHYYTNTDPTDFCDTEHPMAKYGYTARNLNISYDELRDSLNYYFNITIPLPVKLGQDYLDKVLNGELKTTKEFLDFFPGTYLTTTFGTGSMLPVDRTTIVLYYTRRKMLKDVDGNDSLTYKASNAVFTVTKEIIQLNKFENKNPDFLYGDNPDRTFLKSPAGVFTELTIPIKEIARGIGKKKFSNVKLSLKAYLKDEWTYSFPFPGLENSSVPTADAGGKSGYSSKLLLIEPDSVAYFFENKRYADWKNSYTTQFNSSTYSYDFDNISNVVQNAIDRDPDKDLKLLLIPVLTTWTPQYDSYGQPVNIDFMTSHYLYPSGVTLKKGGDNLRVRVIATDIKSKE